MDALPLELKQRICSFLSPKELKSLRLTCKDFAIAAERYFINRFLLSNHPDSLAALCEIADHKTFSKYLATIVYDATILEMGTVQKSPLEDPCRDDYRPKALTLNAHESYAELTTRTMRDATDEYQAAWNEVTKAKAHQTRLEDLISYQRTTKVSYDFPCWIEYAMIKCGRLRHIVLSSKHRTKVNKARAQAFEITYSPGSGRRI